MGIAPLSRGLAEQRDIKQIGFVGIDKRCLGLGECRRQECFFDGVGVDAVVDLGEGALEAPIELQAAVFILLKPLKFRDEIEFELGTEPRTELERDVFVSVCAAVSTGTGNQAFGPGEFNPLLGREVKTVASGLISNSLEFGGIKMRVVDPLPYTKEQNSVFVLQPLFDERASAVEVAHHVSERDVVAFGTGQYADLCSLDGDGDLFEFTHFFCASKFPSTSPMTTV